MMDKKTQFFLIKAKKLKVTDLKENIRLLQFKKEFPQSINTVLFINNEEYKDHLLIEAESLRVLLLYFSSYILRQSIVTLGEQSVKKFLLSLTKEKELKALEVGDEVYVSLNKTKAQRREGIIRSLGNDNLAIVEIRDSILTIPLEVSLDMLTLKKE